MMRFAPDKHSAVGPLWGPAGPALREAVARVLAEHFGVVLDAFAIMEEAHGGTPNSRNVRVLPPRRVVKRLASGGPCCQVVEAARRAQHLGVPFPAYVCTARGPVVEMDGWAWTTTDYCDGTHFAGDRETFLALARTVGEDVRALAEIPGDLLLARPIIGAAEWSWVERAAPFAFRHLREVQAALPRLQALPLRTTHIDLHPHNLLCADGKVTALLDPASLQRAPWATALGYAAYKLTRQHLVAEGGDPVEAAAAFCSAAEVEDAEILWLGAKAEMLRRIATIAEAGDRGDHTWRADFDAHIRALHEIDAMRKSA